MELMGPGGEGPSRFRPVSPATSDRVLMTAVHRLQPNKSEQMYRLCMPVTDMAQHHILCSSIYRR